jgi:malate dehydrogenase (oxaloacetate-decarboxylating)(NADP+)
MEGKAVLFKKFADIDVFDIEVETTDIEEFIKTVENIACTFGGINLEDIAAPHCFEIERKLSKLLDIPVFHDDQHGTAIIIAAGLLNALEIQGKTIQTAIIVCLGAGAAGIASMQLLEALGAKKENLYMLDRGGVIHTGRDDLNEYKAEYAVTTEKRNLLDACTDADVFIGVSGPNLLSEEAVKAMAPKPIIFALSNPDPEIDPALAKAVRPDLIMATGRSDYPNQVNNVLGFPFIFRGALDVRASCINREMQIAAVEALADLAKEEVPEEVLKAYGKDEMTFGAEYIIPTPLDPRLRERVPQAIAQAAIDTGVAKERA